MKHLAAYLLLGLGGNASPSAEDVKSVLESVGIEADDERLSKLISELEGKDINEVRWIETSSLRFASAVSDRRVVDRRGIAEACVCTVRRLWWWCCCCRWRRCCCLGRRRARCRGGEEGRGEGGVRRGEHMSQRCATRAGANLGRQLTTTRTWVSACSTNRFPSLSRFVEEQREPGRRQDTTMFTTRQRLCISSHDCASSKYARRSTIPSSTTIGSLTHMLSAFVYGSGHHWRSGRKQACLVSFHALKSLY